MRARSAILLLVAAIIAGGAALLAHSWLQTRMRQIAQSGTAAIIRQPGRMVLVARAAIRRGAILRPEALIWQPWPDSDIDKSYIVEGGARTPESFAGWVAVNPFTKGEPITLGKVIAPGDRGFLAAVLQPGMRAISVPVTVTSGISGFIFPGDRVDLLLTYAVPSPHAKQDRRNSYEHRATETVLRDLRVVAIDQRLQVKPGEAVVAHTATFEVTPKQAEAIALASEIGRLSLTLHSLVAAPTGAAGAGSSMPDAPPGTAADAAPDSPIAATATYTLDSEISPLLPKSTGDGDTPQVFPVTVLHGLSGRQINFPLGSARSAAKGG